MEDMRKAIDRERKELNRDIAILREKEREKFRGRQITWTGGEPTTRTKP